MTNLEKRLNIMIEEVKKDVKYYKKLGKQEGILRLYDNGISIGLQRVVEKVEKIIKGQYNDK